MTCFWEEKERTTHSILFHRLHIWPLSITMMLSEFWKPYRTKRINWLWQSKTNLIMFLLSLALPKHFSLLLIHKCIMYNVYIDKLLLTYKAQIVTSEIKIIQKNFSWIIHIPCLTKDGTQNWKFVDKNHWLTKLFLFANYFQIIWLLDYKK